MHALSNKIWLESERDVVTGFCYIDFAVHCTVLSSWISRKCTNLHLSLSLCGSSGLLETPWWPRLHTQRRWVVQQGRVIIAYILPFNARSTGFWASDEGKLAIEPFGGGWMDQLSIPLKLTGDYWWPLFVTERSSYRPDEWNSLKEGLNANYLVQLLYWPRLCTLVLS